MKQLKSVIRQQVFESKNLYSFYRYLNYLKTGGMYLYQKKYPIQDVIVCGIQRSGSTALFNIIREIIKAQFYKLDDHFETDLAYRNLLRKEKSFYIKKTHQMSWLVAKRIESNTSIGFFTHRDIRDIVVSMMQKGWIQDLNKWLDEKRLHEIINNSLIYANTKNMHIFSYEDIMYEKKNVIEKIQGILDIHLDDDETAKILENTSIENARKIMEKVDGQEEYDRITHIHKDHIADAKIGKWKYSLSEEQIAEINRISQDFLMKFGYEVS